MRLLGLGGETDKDQWTPGSARETDGSVASSAYEAREGDLWIGRLQRAERGGDDVRWVRDALG